MRERLTPAMTTFVIVDVILVITFLVLVALLRPSLSPGGDAGASATSSSPTSSAPPETTPEASAPVDPTGPAAALTTFVLPSGNIWCQMTETSATCTILSFTYTPPAPPQGCTGTVGHVLQVVAGQSAQMVCPDDVQPVPDGTPTLEYGHASSVGEMTCHSSTNGATCLHNTSGVGFSVARAGYRFF